MVRNPLRFCLLTALLAVAATHVHSASAVRINEFLASSNRGLADEDGDFSDWIELHNTGASPVNLADWSLTDSEDELRKWELPSVIIPADGYLIVFASGKNRQGARLHANFALSADGEYLALVAPDGSVVSEFSPAFPSQQVNFSYGYDSSGELAFFSSPTPNQPNTGSGTDFVADTEFSHDRGFFDAPFNLVITTDTAGATIRYTTNGQAPTATSGIIYNSPINISETTVLRAAAYRTGMQPSNVDTQTYLFTGDVIHQSPTGAPPPGWPASWGLNVVDYGMDPDVVNDPRYRDTIEDDLKSIPTFSIVMNLNDLFNPSTGIYAQPRQDGRDWERPCSIELIHPDGNEGFQSNAGIRIRGGFSRAYDNPKHAFRLFFRSEYGDSRLEYPVFGPDAAQSFDKFDLRTFQNYSWSFQNDGRGIFMRDQFSRDTQLDMGSQAERGDFYHLFINGHYWGLYNTCERPEANYGESYFGGDEEDYDVVKVDSNGYTIYATDGNMTAWNSLYNLVKFGNLATDSVYQRLQGNNPDGTPNPSYPVYLDIPNLIDYMLVIFYGGNLDAPISQFLSNNSPNNWYGLRNRQLEARQGFQFFVHDAEHTLLPDDQNGERDRTGPFPAGDSDVSKSNPQWIFQRLWANAEFKIELADRIHRHFYNGGTLTTARNIERLNRRKNEIDRAVVAESARWGDAKRSTPFTRDNHWLPAVNSVLSFMNNRSSTVLDQLRDKGLYPQVAAPSFSRHGGNIVEGYSLNMDAPAGTIWFTLDGTDPRLVGGALSSKAIEYTDPVALNENALVKARVLHNGVWSALNEAEFLVIRDFKELMISEIMYNPPDFSGADGEGFEFIELKNIGSDELDLSGIQFTNGISYRFPNGTKLAPGSFYLLVSNPDQFSLKYPSARVDGVYEGQLSNGGEALALVHAAGAPIAQFTYDDSGLWPGTADGTGFSLVPVAAGTDTDWSDPTAWRASSQLGGSPGADDPPVNIPPVVINEIITQPVASQTDAIELFNPSDAPADVGGWYLSDSLATPMRYQIPADTVIEPGGFLVLDESHFNAQPGSPGNFGLSGDGEEVYLFSADSAGDLTGYSQGFSFGAAEAGIPFGRYTNSVGEVLHPALSEVTLGQPNALPRIGPIVISEVRYKPVPGVYEFLEIVNVSSSTVPLHDPLHPSNRWQLGGVDFLFPEGASLAPNEIAVISSIEPSAFRSQNNVPAAVQIFGPYNGNLQENGELLRLLQPGVPDEDGSVPRIVVDAVRYSNRQPWPAVSGTSSIERIDNLSFGNDPANWRTSLGAASPGTPNNGNRVPQIASAPHLELVSATFPFAVEVTAEATDDGLPLSPGALSYEWSQTSGPGLSQIQDPDQPTATFNFPGVGAYIVRVEVSDGEYIAANERTIQISRPLAKPTFVSRGSVWKYLDNGSNPQIAWRNPDYNDSSWKQGPAPLGYGNSPATTIGYGPDGNQKYPASYFRHEFNVTDANNVTSLTASLMRDDGAIVYLNGQEVFRSNMPNGPVGYLTYAANVVGGAEETTFFEQAIPTTALREGRNVLAVEVHQANAGSSDLGFDFELTGLADYSNGAPAANAGPDITVELPAPAELAGQAADDGLPEPPGVYTATWTVDDGPGQVTFANRNLPATTASFSAPGEYILRLTVTDGTLTDSDVVQVTVTGGDAFSAWQSTHFSPAELLDPEISGDSADPDEDRMNNNQEFLAGTDPRDSESYLHVEGVALEDGDFLLRFDAVGDKSYTIQRRAHLAESEWEPVINLPPQGETQPWEVLDPIADGKTSFYRIITPSVGTPD